MKDIPEENRGASFKLCLALYDPNNEQIHLTYGETKGKIPKRICETNKWLWLRSYFYIEEVGKTYAEMTLQEKNNCSHRGKALGKMKYILG